jgi:hypothetical protein
MDCLTSKVGFKSCGDEHEVFIDDFIGIKEVISASIYEPTTYSSYLEHYKAVKRVAYKNMLKNALIQISRYKSFVKILTQSESPFEDYSTLIPKQDRLVGVKVEIPYNLDSNVFLSQFSVIAENKGSAELVILDVKSQRIINQKTVEINRGVNHLKIGLHLSTEEQGGIVFVGINQKEITLNGFSDSPFRACGCDSKTIPTFSRGYISSCNSYDFDACDDKNIGVSLKAVVGCSFENFICRNWELFLQIYAWYEAREHYLNTMSSTRVNYYQQSSVVRAEQIFMPEAERQIKSEWVLFHTQIENYVQDSMCFKCNPRITGGVFVGDSF